MHNLLSRSVRNGLLTGLAFIASSVMLSACSVSVPSADEQAILAKDNNLPGGAPIWFTRATGGGAGYGGAATGNGIIPQVVTPPPAVAAKNESVEYPILVRSQEQAKQSESKPVAQAMSALDRINDQCPGSESEVNTTLTNTNRDEKIASQHKDAHALPMIRSRSPSSRAGQPLPSPSADAYRLFLAFEQWKQDMPRHKPHKLYKPTRLLVTTPELRQ